jgi:peptidoglycan hydrolase-like protein with peptidoglycan-binding domain
MKKAGKQPALRIYATRTSRKDKTIAMQGMLKSAGYSVGNVDGIYGQNTIHAVKTFQRLEGLKVTGTATQETLDRLRRLTRKSALPDGQLYVRIKQKAVFETGFEISNADKPLGTHLVLLADLSEERADWLSVSVPTQLKKTTMKDHGIDPVYANQKVNVSITSVLDRLEIPEKARVFISERLSPGTSFAISDNGLGTETGKGTDFIVPVY